MSKRRMRLVPAIVASILAIHLQARAEPAEDCAGAPKPEAPEGSHWYYRHDETSHHKCWFLAPVGLKIQAAAVHKPRHHARPAASASAAVAAQTAEDQAPAAPRPARPAPLAPPAVALPVPPTLERSGAFVTRWPDGLTPSQPVPAQSVPAQPVPAQAAPAAGLAPESADEATAQLPQPMEAASAVPEPGSRSRLMLALIAGVLTVAGVVGGARLRHSAARAARRRRRADASIVGAFAQDRMPRPHTPMPPMEELMREPSRHRLRAAARRPVRALSCPLPQTEMRDVSAEIERLLRELQDGPSRDAA